MSREHRDTFRSRLELFERMFYELVDRLEKKAYEHEGIQDEEHVDVGVMSRDRRLRGQ